MADEDTGRFPEGWEAFTDAGFVQHVGPVHHRTVGERRDFAFRTEEKHVNLVGIVHGGMLVTFADRALSIVAREAAGGADCVTIQLETQFVGAAKVGEVVETTPEIVRQTGSLVFLRAVLTSGDRTLASVSGIWKVLRDKTSETKG